MADDVPPYPFFPPSYAPQQYEQPSFQPQPFVPQPPQEVQKKFICNGCEEPIVEGEEAIYGLYGVAGPGRKSGRLMVMPSKDIPEGEFNIHIQCLSMFIEDHLPEAADEIRQLSYEPEEVEEIFCANCDAKISDEDVG